MPAQLQPDLYRYFPLIFVYFLANAFVQSDMQVRIREQGLQRAIPGVMESKGFVQGPHSTISSRESGGTGYV